MKKTVLITGASSGIGEAIAHSLSHEYNLILLGRNEKCLSKVMFETNAANGYFIDLINANLDNIQESVDILINSAGIMKHQSIVEMTEEQLDDMMEINFKAAFKLTKRVIKDMIPKKWGRIIHIGSLLSDKGNPNLSHYCASKSALVGLARGAAIDLGKYGITCNVVAPGFTKTPIRNYILSKEEEEKKVKDFNLPIQRLGEAQDVANLVKFLISDQAEYITGQNLHINGGFFMN